MLRGRAIRLAFAGLVAASTALPMPDATAGSHIGGKAWAPSYFGWSYGYRSIRTSQDGYRVTSYLKWDTTHYNALRNRIAQTGWRFTQEQNDFGDNLNSGVDNGSPLCQNIMRSTNFPAPVYDTDDDDGNNKHEEAEVTANTASFPPAANTTYWWWQDWSRWTWWGWDGYNCVDWRYDSGGGSWKHLSQLSSWFGEWNAQEWTTEYASTTYGSKSQSAALSGEGSTSGIAAPSTDGDHPQEASAPVGAIVADLHVSLDVEGEETDVRVQPPDSAALVDYIRASRERSRSVLRGEGPFDAVVTFNEPISGEQLQAIDDIEGVTVYWHESISRVADGSIVTVSGTMPSLPDLVATHEAESGTFEGIVAAEVTVDGRRSVRALEGMTEVLLVDLSGEAVRAEVLASGELRKLVGEDKLDVILDDVYWQHAGLLDE